MEPESANLFGLPQELFDGVIEIVAAGRSVDGTTKRLSVSETRCSYKSLLGATAANKVLRDIVQNTFFASHIFEFASHRARPETKTGVLNIQRRSPIMTERDKNKLLKASEAKAFRSPTVLVMYVLPASMMKQIRQVKMRITYTAFDDFLCPIAEFKNLGIEELQSLQVEVRFCERYAQVEHVCEMVKDHERAWLEKKEPPEGQSYKEMIVEMVKQEVSTKGPKVQELEITFVK